MSQQSPDYKLLWLKEQRRREEAEHAQEEAERAREEAERAQEEAEQARERAEEKTRKTTLLELLDACHAYLYSGLTVQADATLSTRGDPTNANNKIRPESIHTWEDFPARQEAIWNDLMGSDFVLERHFTSLHTLEESGEAVRQRMMSSELDLNHFQRYTVEDHISSIIKQLYNNPTLRRKFRLQGSVKFENHANTLSPEWQLEEGIQQMSVSRNQRRRSPRLQAKQAKPSGSTDPAEPAAAATVGAARSFRPRADQFCVYNTSSETQNAEHRIAAFIIEYKAPHKLTLGYIYEGLNDMELEEVVRCRETDSPQDHFRRLVAAIITQAFSYMVQAGLEYGCICTGEAFIFLRVPDDPRMIYYFLSVPKGDVGETTGWTPDSDGENRLHLTAVGQMLAFTLQALKTPPRDQKWRTRAAARLKNWEVVYNDLLDAIPVHDAPSSEYRPPRQNEFLRMSPVQLRRRATSSSSPGYHRLQDRSEPSEDEHDPDTPSRPSRRSPPHHLPQALDPTSRSSSGRDSRCAPKGGQFCTQKCLLGLVTGGLLDKMCPNVRDHGRNHHQIGQPTFLNLIRRQLSNDLDTDCEPVGVHGARGALFKVRLTSHGYTVAAKSTVIDFVDHLKHEANIYKRLRPIQGINAPVHLGNIDLHRPYFYDGIAKLVHMMFLSYAGQPISQHICADNRIYLTNQVQRSIQAVHELGVLHRDARPRNILWNTEVGQAMIIDFERAEIRELRSVLGVVSPNRKKKQVPEENNDDFPSNRW
ncbi:hypothetical protein AOQ84DRAFT_434837 [Glonium stellatum]|uniref:Protein kinase domain-containing protein n=1 Tax=Glonium stellatum TaxID=574774 RepID=A0A8E2EMS9_9PEZI|nr:hypothetical protein AOQ84DRAFT_434837 [Glonium stellatum]